MQTVMAARQKVTSPTAQDAFKRWFDASPIYSGSVVANRLGWQVFRTIAKRGAIALRRLIRGERAPSDLAAVLDRDGIVAIPNFLSDAQHAEVVQAFNTYSSSLLRDIGDENGARINYVTGPVVSDQPGDAGSTINAVFANNPAIIALAEHVIGRKVRAPLRVIYQRLALHDGAADDFDREQILHADKAFPCVKAIYVLDGVSARASPFVYCRGSQRLSRERLRYEYAMGVREAMLRAGRVCDLDRNDGLVFVRSRNAMGRAFRATLARDEHPMQCGPNTLIITNNAGFHRRGRLEDGETRRSLWINFYPYQRPWYGKLAFRAAKALIDTDNVSRALAPVNTRTLDQADDASSAAAAPK